MGRDEDSIREWHDRFIEATTTGDRRLAESLIADDAVYLMPGAPPMDKATMVTGLTASDPNTDFELDASIREISVLGDTAWVWAEFTLIATSKASGSRTTIAGHSISILERSGDSWVTVREANTMSPVGDE